MVKEINALPAWLSVIAYGILGVGWFSVWAFVGLYGWLRPWYQSELGRHVIAFSASVGLFFTLYLILAIWPEFPGRSIIRLVLLVLLVSVCVWRLVIFLKTLVKDARQDRRNLR